jgi:hypothetical protein
MKPYFCEKVPDKLVRRPLARERERERETKFAKLQADSNGK